ncbi:hypothetical protein V8E36_006709 [Tilletia maclaganii]
MFGNFTHLLPLLAQESSDAPDPPSIEEAERVLEVQVNPTSPTGSLTRPGTGYDAVGIISSSTRSRRWASHSMRQGSTRPDRSEPKHDSRSQVLVGKWWHRMASRTTRKPVCQSRLRGGGGFHQPSAAAPLMTASTSAGGRTATYRLFHDQDRRSPGPIAYEGQMSHERHLIAAAAVSISALAL